MAKVTSVVLVDDLDGGTADETLTFSLDGRELEIDLSKQNASGLRDVLAPYVSAARRAGSAPAPRRSATMSTATVSRKSREENTAIREWASSNGFQVSERGRISASILEAYHQRESASTEPEPVEPEPVVAEEKPKRRTRKKVDAGS